MAGKTAREEFLHNLQLSLDPFSTPVAEQEIRRVKSAFYDFFVEPETAEDFLTLTSLQKPEHLMLFAKPGYGKTTLRLALDAYCRTTLSPVITVSYVFSDTEAEPLSREEHGKHLAQALAIDLTLNIIERFNSLSTSPSQEQIDALKPLIHMAGEKLIRTLKSIRERIANDDLDTEWGIATEWERLGRSPVKYVGKSSSLLSLLDALLTPPPHIPQPSLESFFAGVHTAHLWGFTRLLLAVDAVDTQNMPPALILRKVTPLLDLLPNLEERSVYGRFFLPIELQAPIQNHLKNTQPDLYSRVKSITIKWQDSTLRALLRQRLQASTAQIGPRYTSLNQLAAPDLDITNEVIKASRGSPRRMLELIDRLIAIHLEHSKEEQRFTRRDWEQLAKEL